MDLKNRNETHSPVPRVHARDLTPKLAGCVPERCREGWLREWDALRRTIAAQFEPRALMRSLGLLIYLARDETRHRLRHPWQCRGVRCGAGRSSSRGAGCGRRRREATMTHNEALERRLAEMFDGHAWHGAPVLATLRDLTPAQAAATPIAGTHSIWAPALHLHPWQPA